MPSSQDFFKGFPHEKNVAMAVDKVQPVPCVFLVVIFLFLKIIIFFFFKVSRIKDKIKIFNIRPATVCGLSSRMRFDVSVNMLTAQAAHNKKITVLGGKQIRPNIHIEDMTDLYLFLLKTDKSRCGIYNAGFENKSVISIAKQVSKNIDSKIKIR